MRFSSARCWGYPSQPAHRRGRNSSHAREPYQRLQAFKDAGPVGTDSALRQQLRGQHNDYQPCFSGHCSRVDFAGVLSVSKGGPGSVVSTPCGTVDDGSLDHMRRLRGRRTTADQDLSGPQRSLRQVRRPQLLAGIGRRRPSRRGYS